MSIVNQIDCLCMNKELTYLLTYLIGFSLFHSSVRFLIMLLRFLLALPCLGLVRMTGAKRRSTFHTDLLVGAPVIL